MYIDWQSNLVKRVFTSIAIVAGLIAVFSLRFIPGFGLWFFDLVVLVLAGAATWEVMKVKKSDQKGVNVAYVGAYIISAYLMFVLGVVAGFSILVHAIIQVVVVGIFALYTCIMNYMDNEFVRDCELRKLKLGKASWGTALEFLKVIGYPLLLICALIPLNHLGSVATVELGSNDIANVPMFAVFGIILVFVISCLTDTFAYCVGMTFKGPKLCPKISPKKTYSGMIGGLFGGIIGSLIVLMIFTAGSAGWLLSTYLTQQIGETGMVQLWFVFIGIVGSLLTQAGDIYASVLKRRAGVKDYGNFLPGHGGAMDRLDGISWNALFIFISFLIIALI